MTTERHFPRHPRLPGDAYRRPDSVFHVIVRAFPGTEPFTARETASPVWECLVTEQLRAEAHIHTATLMPDHLHLLLSPGTVDPVTWVGRFKSLTTRRAWPTGTRRKLWQPSFYDRRLRDGEFEEVLRYVLSNPMVAGLADDIEEWPWSGCWV